MLLVLKNKMEDGVKGKMVSANSGGTQDGIHDIEGDLLTETEQNILAMMRQNDKVTIEAMTEQIGVSRRTINRNIKMLKEKGFV